MIMNLEKNKGYNPLTIANFLISLNPSGLTLLQILKLSYISHGFTLALLNKPLSSEKVEAWMYGPVFCSIYERFKIFEGLITQQITCQKEEISQPEKHIMKLVNIKYGLLSGWALSALTHAEDTPWKNAYNKGEKEISNEEIQSHYKSMISNPNKQTPKT